ncbi:hypothetical protein TNIN_239081 [Trichonephila inaurata madagascariensis]|uniref:Uncharacterized protein n=1 Tax=Trichonephila inaurata madagascariensis TaxID=2747483 RepID=A0A8X7BPT2_9ARAC|nr:hypothetical protein TNIN_239081 [Trichonephila inaurata madagascariensis]
MNEGVALGKKKMRLKKEKRVVENGDMFRNIKRVKQTNRNAYKVPPRMRFLGKKGETSVDVIRGKDSLNPVILSKERVDLGDDDIEEEMRLKKGRWLMEEQTRHVQQEINEHKKQNEMLSKACPGMGKKRGKHQLM